MSASTGKKFPGTLKRSKFYKLCKLATGGQQKVLTGLDNISQRFGHENFEHIRLLVNRIVDLAPQELSSHRQTLMRHLDEFQHFLKYEYVSHLKPTSPCAAHCINRLLGGHEHGKHCLACEKLPDGKKCKPCHERSVYCTDCPETIGNRDDHCKQCDELYQLFAELHCMLQIAKGLPAAEINMPRDELVGDSICTL